MSETYEAGRSLTEKRQIRRDAKKFTLKGNCMYYIGENGLSMRRVILTEKEKVEVLTEVHAGHFAVKRMLDKINQRFYWKGITRDVQEWVKTCMSCQRFEHVKTEAPALKPIKPKSPWHMIGVDLIGPFKASKNGNRFCLTATDFFTKWVEARPIKDKTAIATSQAMMDIFYTHGAPEVILTDQGREFWNKVNKSLFEEFGVKHRITSAYHPQTNGLDERTNQTLKRSIGKNLDGQQERWEDQLKEIVFSNNCCVQASSRYSPYRLMYGREPRLFSETTGDLPDDVDIASPDNEDIEKYVQARAESDGKVIDKVIANVEKAQERQKEAYKRRTTRGTKRFKITPGMEVLKKNERKRGRHGQTMDPDWPTVYSCRKSSLNSEFLQMKNCTPQLAAVPTVSVLKMTVRSMRPQSIVEDFPVLDSGSENTLKDAPSPSSLTTPNQNYISDSSVPPGEPWLEVGPSRAALSLPFCLNLEPEPSDVALAGSSSKEWVVEMGVHAKIHLQEGLIFGPFVGELAQGAPRTSLSYAWIIREDSEFYYVDGSDENKSNWMRYVSYAAKEEDHNLIVVQLNQQIYYKTSKPISEGGELKVRIGEDYAATLCLDPADTRCDFGKKESILRLYLDVQLVTVEEPSSSLWFNSSQLQDAMPIIHKVTSTSTPDSAVDAGPASGCGPTYLHEEYNFFPGTENLLNHPTQGHHRLWYFYGFRPGAAGQPPDWSTAVCKLCGEPVALADTVGHLNLKHQISSQRFLRGQRIRNSVSSAQKSTSLTPALSGSLDWASTPPFHLRPPTTTDALSGAVCNFLIRDLYQPAMVEGRGFKELIQTLLPSYKELPSARAVDALLRDLHAKEKKRLLELLRCRTAAAAASQDEEESALDYTPQSETQETPSRHSTDAARPVTLSADVWRHVWRGETSRNATLWAHYVDANFEPQNWALTTRRLEETETEAEGVEAQVKAMALDWGITRPHLVLLGGDTAESGGPGPRRRDQRGEPGGQDPAPGPTVPCFFAAVQGCVEEVTSFPVVSETLRMFQGVLSGLFTLCPRSNPFRSQIELLLLKMASGERAHLQSWAHSPLGWKGLYTVVNILNKHRALLSELMKLETGTIVKHEHPTEEDSGVGGGGGGADGVALPGEAEWKVMQELCAVLKPLDVACRTLAKEAFPRLSLIKPILIGLLTRLLVAVPGEAKPLTKVKTRVRERLAGCYEDPAVNRILCVACSLDPQFRHLGFMAAQEQTLTHDWLKEEAVRMMKEDQRGRTAARGIKRSSSLSSSDSYDNNQPRRSKRIKNAPPISFRGCEDAEDEDSDGEDGAAGGGGEKEPAEADADADPQGALSGMQFLLGDLLGSPAAGAAPLPEEEAADMELSLFAADKRPSSGAEPLQWWKAKAGQFPLLAAVARAYLGAPAVAGAAAVDFAAAGGAFAEKRRNIPPESLAEMLFLHHNHVTTPTD